MKNVKFLKLKDKLFEATSGHCYGQAIHLYWKKIKT